MHSRLADQSLHGAATFFAYFAPAAFSRDFSVAVWSAIRSADVYSVSFNRASWALAIRSFTTACIWSLADQRSRNSSIYTSLRFFGAGMGAPWVAAKATADQRNPLPAALIRRTFCRTALDRKCTRLNSS